MANYVPINPGAWALLKTAVSFVKKNLLFSSVELITFGVVRWLRPSSKCTIFWINIGLCVYSDLYKPDFPKSTTRYLCYTKILKRNGCKFFTAMCHFWMQCSRAIHLLREVVQTNTHTYTHSHIHGPPDLWTFSENQDCNLTITYG